MIHLFRPNDRPTVPAGSDVYAPELYNTWMRAFPDAQPQARDKEDWVENACFLEAFERLGVDYEILDTIPGGLISSTADFALDGKGPAAFFHTGISPRDQITSHNFTFPFQNSQLIDLATGYAQSETFKAAAGRRLITCRLNRDDINEAIRTIEPKRGNVFVKTIRKQSAGIIFHDATSLKSPSDQLFQQNEDLMWDMVRFEGSDQPYLVIQDVIEPTYEYRMFMVDGIPVTGAGCIEEFTPLNNTGLYDNQMARIRNQSEITEESDIVARYYNFAFRFGADYAKENGEKLVYSLDLCIDQRTGDVVPIEINPPANLGRYASDTDAWVLAIDQLKS